jgi:hypothetical protein
MFLSIMISVAAMWSTRMEVRLEASYFERQAGQAV